MSDYAAMNVEAAVATMRCIKQARDTCRGDRVRAYDAVTRTRGMAVVERDLDDVIRGSGNWRRVWR